MKRYRRLFKRLGHARWFAFLGRTVFARIDRAFFRLSRGRLVPIGTVSPVLLLTTVGRRSGRKRTTPVIYVDSGTASSSVARTGGTSAPGPPGL